MNDATQQGGGRGVHFWHTMYKYVSKTSMVALQGGRGSENFKICVVLFMSTPSTPYLLTPASHEIKIQFIISYIPPRVVNQGYQL